MLYENFYQPVFTLLVFDVVVLTRLYAICFPNHKNHLRKLFFN
jgi:hypothetical protein